MSKSETIETILKERGGRYGDIEAEALVRSRINRAIQPTGATAVHEHCMYMVATKLARALNGDLRYSDNYKDAAGYLLLLAEYYEKESK